ncbi:MAG: hypothetical protein Q8941_03140 [Bacteroidota bacterium]|nr:hypothetical protein [Bacteroidota bacterium]
MKKVFAIMAIAAMFAACNNSTDTSAEDAAKKTADSTHQADSIANAMKMQQAVKDSTAKADSSKMKMGADSSKMKMGDSKMEKKDAKKDDKMQKK